MVDKKTDTHSGPAISVGSDGRLMPWQRVSLRRLLPVLFIGSVVLCVGIVAFYIVKDQRDPQKHNAYLSSKQDRLSEAKSKNSEAKTSAEQAQAAVEVGDAYRDNDKPEAAIESYQKALKLDESVKRKALGGLFYAYAQAGQNQQAIETGNELIAYLKTLKDDDGTLPMSIQNYQNMVTMLKNGESIL